MHSVKSERFGLILTPTEKAALQALAERDGLPAAAIVRSLIRQAAKGLSAESQKVEPLTQNAPGAAGR